MDFEIVGDIRDIEVIAISHGIHRRRLIIKRYGKGRWRKLKGTATVRLADGSLREAEVHWYEAHGVGCRAFKLKRFLD